MSLIPFTIELFADYFLIKSGRKDLNWGIRIPLMVACSIVIWQLPAVELHVGRLIACLIPYCFFDIVLNKLRGKNWDYLNNTKYWDRNLLRVNPYFLLVVRVVVALGLGYLVLSL